MFNFATFPVFKLGSANMRALNANDAFNYMEYMNLPEVRRFVTANNIPASLDEAIREVEYWGGLFRTQTSICWAIECNITKRLIGTIGFNYWSKQNRRVEVNYDLDPAYWGRGIMTDAVKAATDFALNKLEVVRIQATVQTENARSIKLLEKLNFIKEGRLANYEILDTGPADYYMYARGPHAQ